MSTRMKIPQDVLLRWYRIAVETGAVQIRVTYDQGVFVPEFFRPGEPCPDGEYLMTSALLDLALDLPTT